MTEAAAALPDRRPADEDAHAGHAHGHGGPLVKMMAGAVGIVYGDIGTSPLYAFRETFAGHHPMQVDEPHVLGVLSLIFWSMMIVVTLKYVTIITRADNKGEGGSLALLALISRSANGQRSWTRGIVLLGVFATALFYGDSMITPAISVLGAVEGLKVVRPGMDAFVLPIAVGILVALFAIQARGTARVAVFFSPIMIVYFLVLAALGLWHILSADAWIIVETLNPLNAIGFFILDPLVAFLALGSVVLAVTGAEALYADMGHFGRRPIAWSWLAFVLPALLLNYMGQGAMILSLDAAGRAVAIQNPFFLMAPEAMRGALVILATCAAVIASQAVISGAFSVTQQAIQLGFIPRLRIDHTSETQAGQIYIPVINWVLMVMVIVLVLMFQSSSSLASAYGIAVTGAMLIDTVLISVVLFTLWKWKPALALPLLVLFFIVDLAYFSANMTKVPDGGWFPLLIGFIAFTLLTTWAKGRKLMQGRLKAGAMPISIFVQSAANSATRVPGTAVFMTSASSGVPPALLHNLKHNKVLHERIVLLTVEIQDVPFVPARYRVERKDLGQNFHRVVLRYGFMQEPNVPAGLAEAEDCGPEFRMMDTSFFLARQTLISAKAPGMQLWREKLFFWMLRNAESPMEFFRLPSNRVVELGSQVEI